jgi:UDP-N-acetylmuramoyl-tripeptide--D-alanyl-D-alanine ligase
VINRTLASVATVVEGELVGPDAVFAEVSTDTRRLSAGGLYVAIRGEHFDGNDFVAEACAKGAVGALVLRSADVPIGQICVADTRRAFGRMAAAWRANFGVPVIAVTGSNGKTTVKGLIASILGVRCHVCVTEGNLNNDIGVPLTLMRLTTDHEALVVELGANHAGEIDYLGGLVEPTVGLITNANAAHLEGFGSIDGVAAAKGELLDHLPRAGTAVLNADDPYCADWSARSRAETVITFGFAAQADCTVVGTPVLSERGACFRMRLPDDELIDVELPLAGRHNVLNALAAAAAAHAAGTSAADISAGLARATAVAGRLRVLGGRSGGKVIDDSYNANPASVRAALDYLEHCAGTRVLVLGSMAELGSATRSLHRATGEYAQRRCDVLIGVGELACAAADAFGAGGRCVDDIDAAYQALAPLLAAGETTVLVKGSRVAGLEQLVALLAVDGNGRAH